MISKESTCVHLPFLLNKMAFLPYFADIDGYIRNIYPCHWDSSGHRRGFRRKNSRCLGFPLRKALCLGLSPLGCLLCFLLFCPLYLLWPRLFCGFFRHFFSIGMHMGVVGVSVSEICTVQGFCLHRSDTSQKPLTMKPKLVLMEMGIHFPD